MSVTPHTSDRAATLRRLALGAAMAVAAGAGAGEALRPQAVEWHAPAAPQQIVAPEARLIALERQGGGWPARAIS